VIAARNDLMQHPAGEAGDGARLDTSAHSEGGSTSHPLHAFAECPEFQEIRLIADNMQREIERVLVLADRICPQRTQAGEDRCQAETDPHAPRPSEGQDGRAG
jgi:hypothetical protein